MQYFDPEAKITKLHLSYILHRRINVCVPFSRTDIIPRGRETLMHVEIEGLFPSGEGAGYAGGIVSAAIDGERCAEHAVKFIR